MKPSDITILVTGGAGFIGSNFVHMLVAQGYRVINLDALTYAGHRASLHALENNPRHVFVAGRIGDRGLVDSLLATHRPQYVVNFAAESHVDRSIDGPADFVHTNVVETQILLDRCLSYWKGLGETARAAFRFLHISTDEVYGSLGAEGLFTEQTPYAPNSPYAASKAASDHFVRAYHHTYGLPVVITNCSNNYGPYQYPEKLIPLIILNAMEGKPLPVYGQGSNVRDWLYVEDHCRGILTVLLKGRVDAKYNIGGNSEQRNIDVVKTVCQLLDELVPNSAYKPHAQLIEFVRDRPGHDQRYAIDASKIKAELHWAPQENFVSGLRKTVQWYLANQAWCRTVTTNVDARQRLGVAK
jgi:dTDP-glucose 4,6-dehydratase